MRLSIKARDAIVFMVLSHGLVGCGGLDTSAAPSAVTPSLPPPIGTSTPIVTSMSGNTGSTGGGTPLRIVGSGFQMAVTVTFGTARVDRREWDPRVPGGASGSLIISTPAHAPGLVDVIVTNPGGQPLRLANAFEYLAPQSFDFNGSWDGDGSDGNHIGVGFTIRNNVLIAASCVGADGAGPASVSLSSPVIDGEFAAVAGDGFRISGRIVSASDAIGKITVPVCGIDVPWQAARSQ